MLIGRGIVVDILANTNCFFCKFLSPRNILAEHIGPHRWIPYLVYLVRFNIFGDFRVLEGYHLVSYARDLIVAGTSHFVNEQRFFISLKVRRPI